MDLQTLYDVQEEIGRGSYGVVRKCVNRSTQSVVAIKEINFYLNSDGEEATANEIEICRKLQHHERIVILEDVIYCEDHVCLVFEYLSGGDLFEGILERNWYSEKEACQLAQQVLEAVQHCHRMRVIHRDLKPENLLLCRKPNRHEIPQLKLTDFGIACEIPDGSELVSCATTGSPLYMAPERILERPCGYGVDVWSCGVIIFVLMAGYPPFWSEDLETLFLRIVQGNFSFHSPYWSKASNDVKDLIKRMLEVNPHQRISASKALNHSWFRNSTQLSSENQEKTLKTLQAFNRRRKFKSIALMLIARKRLSSQVSKKVDKERTRRTSTSYIPDSGFEGFDASLSRRKPVEEIFEKNSEGQKAPEPRILKVTIKVLDG